MSPADECSGCSQYRCKPRQDQLLAHPQDQLEAALLKKRKQHFAATLGHVDIPIAPLVKQIQMLISMLEEQKDADCNANHGTVLHSRTLHPKRGEIAKIDSNKSTSTLESARSQKAQALVETGVGYEKFLGTWI